MKQGALILLSGGIDSCATVALYRRRSPSVSALFVDYGQAAVDQERCAVARVVSHYGISLSTVQCAGLGALGAGYVRGRNALLLQLALVVAPFDVGQIAIGLHAGTSYPDCSPAFVAEMQRVVDVYCEGKMRVVAPFIDQDKPGIVAFCREQAVPLDLTYSCERGTVPTCGQCASCLDRKALDVG